MQLVKEKNRTGLIGGVTQPNPREDIDSVRATQQ